MINTVEKKYNGSDFVCYKIVFSDNSFVIVPNDTNNRHYQEIQEWIAEGNTVIDNGGGE